MLIIGTILLCCACSDSVDDADEVPVLHVNVYVPQTVMTRGYEGDVNSYTSERAVHSLHIWVYNHADVTLNNGSTLSAGTCIAYLHPTVTDLQSGTVQRYAVTIDNEVAKAHPNVDVYVVANEESIGATGLDGNTTRAQLRALTISGAYFGVSQPVTISDIQDQGLPMSGYGDNLLMKADHAPVYEVETVEIERAVSKMRFVFARTDGDIGDMFMLDELSIGGNVIPTSENFINTSGGNYSISSTYESSAMTWNGESTPALPTFSQVPAISPPSTDIYTDQDPQAYENLVDEGVSTSKLAQLGPFYLRETNRRLSGTIRYRVKQANGSWQQKNVTFNMASAGDFVRNHTWTVYVYFLGGKLYVKPTVLPWTAGQDRWNYSTQGATTMEWNSYLRYDLDMRSNTWDDTYVAVAFGYRTGHEPLYSPPITLRTTNSHEIWVQVDNDDFEIVQKEGTSYESKGQVVVIPANSEDEETVVYVVPVNGENPPNPLTRLTLTARPSDGMPPYNIPYNHDLPGDEDHTSILIWNIGAQLYRDNQNNQKVPGNVQTSNYWIETNT